VRRHLRPPELGSFRRPHRLQQHLVRSRPQRQAKPAGPYNRNRTSRYFDSARTPLPLPPLHARARILKKDFLLPPSAGSRGRPTPSRGEHDAITHRLAVRAQALIRLVCEGCFSLSLGSTLVVPFRRSSPPPGLSLAHIVENQKRPVSPVGQYPVTARVAPFASRPFCLELDN